jgi:signal transduction histidine kinase
MLVGRKLDQLGEGIPTPDGITATVEARELLDRTADEVRQISRALRPSILDDLGLMPALRSEVSALARRSDIRTRFSAPPSVRASAEAELVLLRVTQEALYNVERHAAATHVGVRLVERGSSIVLVIRDDGRGPGQLASAAGLLAAGRLGVVGMEERTRLVGGDFVLRPAKPRGTLVCVAVPRPPATSVG